MTVSLDVVSSSPDLGKTTYMVLISSSYSSRALGSTAALGDSLNGMQEVRKEKQEPEAMYERRRVCGTTVAWQRQGGVSAFEEWR